ncbi:MAG: alpha/beta hydrolase [Clostridia bacterium]|nr:alpha/beta hydrolase [Clostridia bacterium]
MAGKIVLYISGVLGLLALIYVIIGIIIARRILKPPFRTEEMIFQEESVKQKISEDILNSPYQRVEISGHNRYKLSARIYTADKASNKWIVALHGYNNRSLTIAKYARIFNKLGYNVLAPDMRRSGLSGGKTITFGYYERKDAEDWLEYLYSNYKDIKIGLFGISLGASTGILVASIRPDIRFLISYCSFSSFRDVIAARGPDYFSKIMLLYPAIIFGAYILSRSALNTIDIVDAVKDVTCPMLIMHSRKDAFTPYEQALKLSKANPDAKLHLFSEGAHARAYSVSPEEYEKVMTDFIQNSDK